MEAQPEIEFRSDGLILPRINRDSIMVPALGQVVYDTVSAQLYYYNGTIWSAISPWIKADQVVSYSEGNVGIGTADPEGKLTIRGNDQQLRIEEAFSEKIWSITTTSPGFGIYEDGITGRFCIDTSGNIGIGTDYPFGKLTIRDNHQQFRIEDDDNGKAWSISSFGVEGLGIFEDGSDARLTIDGGGNVGIGTTDPSGKLTIRGDNQQIRILDSNNEKLWGITTVNDQGLGFYENGSIHRMSIDAGGNVGIGTTNPSGKLTIRDENQQIRIQDANNEKLWGITTVNDQGLGFYENGSIHRMSIDAGGNVGIGTNNPGARLEIDGQIKITGGSPANGRVLTSDQSGMASWQNSALTLPFAGTAAVFSGYAMTINNPLFTGIRGIGGVTGVIGEGPNGVFGSSQSPDGYGGNFVNSSDGGAGILTKAGDGNTADIILGGNDGSGTGDNGRIHSDPDYSSSDIILVSNDEVAIHLDEDGNGEDADFVVKDKDDVDLFKVDESGDITWAEQLGYIAVDAHSFSPEESGYEFVMVNGGFRPCNVEGTFDDEQLWSAGLFLPHGAKLKTWTIYFEDNDDKIDLSFKFFRRPFQNVPSTIVSASSSGDIDNLQSIVVDLEDFIADNSQESYFVSVTYPNGYPDCGQFITVLFKSMKIEYTTTEPY